MEYDFKEILDVGLEIEFSNLKRDTHNFIDNLMKKNVNFKVVHDASAESPEVMFGNIPVQFNGNNRFLSILKFRDLETIGGELNSPIMSSENYKEHIYKLIDFLRDMGESYSTTDSDNRGSIHVHINVSKDITHKNLIRLLEVGLATEALFYKLGGMGGVNRGVKNSFTYQRPLTMPPCVCMNGRFYPIFDYKDLLESKNKTDFYNKYGDTIVQIHHGNHYVTQRYTGLNFYSIPYRGSIEFRYSNKVLSPEWICAWISLCQSFVNYALTKSKDKDFENNYRKLEDNREIPEEELLLVLDKINVPDDAKITLLDIWRSSTTPKFDGKHLISHLDNPTFFSRDTGYYTKPVENAVNSKAQNVRDIQGVKNNQLGKLKSPNFLDGVEKDYIIDDTGVKTKLKGLNNPYYEEMSTNNYYNINIQNPNIFRMERNNVNLGDLDAKMIEKFKINGFDILNFNNDIAKAWIQTRIQNSLFFPVRILRDRWWYSFETEFDDVNLHLRTVNNGKEVEFYGIYLPEDKSSPVDTVQGVYSKDYKSYVYDFSNITAHMHFDFKDYFNLNDDIHEEEEHDFDILENEEDNQIIDEPQDNFNDAVAILNKHLEEQRKQNNNRNGG